MNDERPRGRARKVALAGVVVGVLTVVVALAGWLSTRPAGDTGRSAAQVAAAPVGSPQDRADDGVTAPADAPAPPAQSTVQAVPAPTRDTVASDRPAAGDARQGGPATSSRNGSGSGSGSGPVRVAVPALGVDAEIDAVGVEPDGSMTIPASADRVGWYRWGPAPGAPQGSAVLAGHVDTARDGPGAFAPLSALEVGQDVVVTLGDGTEHSYRVEGRQSVTKSELPVDVLFARDGPPRLTLITCGGPFQPELRSYRDNVIVTAVPVGSP